MDLCVLPASSSQDSSELMSARLAVRLNSSSDPDDMRLEGLDSTAGSRNKKQVNYKSSTTSRMIKTHLKDHEKVFIS